MLTRRACSSGFRKENSNDDKGERLTTWRRKPTRENPFPKESVTSHALLHNIKGKPIIAAPARKALPASIISP